MSVDNAAMGQPNISVKKYKKNKLKAKAIELTIKNCRYFLLNLEDMFSLKVHILLRIKLFVIAIIKEITAERR